MLQKSVTIINKLGLHARAAAKFVSKASRFASQVEIICGDQRVNGKSIMGVMMLAVTQGTHLQLVISGEDEDEAWQALDNLIHSKFGEAE